MSVHTAYPTAPAPRSLPVRRRIATYFTGGVEEIPRLVGVLAQRGHLVHELSVDIRDGVRESSMACAVLLPGDEIEQLLTRLRELPAVVSAELT
ncbi:hypothetical protein [Amycolatopsis thermophila]|uniref:ACT domain-containing protein n=1 Tax=Amycolatopsis thermophila TaxID=206084 RepID=A0ABU0EZH6_9PSEU|nr:hypothetical protein [Amycolatopsis thermophila]MDQ0380346.1 hypothetical protein [Amycolatopsis thermophila]